MGGEPKVRGEPGGERRKANRKKKAETRAALRGLRLKLVLKRVKVPLMRMLKGGLKLTMPRCLVTAVR